MNTGVNVNEIIDKIDALLSAGEDAQAEKTLIDAIAQYTEAEPDNVVGQSVLLNELGGFYRNRGILDKGEEAYLKAKALLEKIREYSHVVDGPDEATCCSCSGQSSDSCFSKSGDEENQSYMEVILINERLTANYATTLNNLAGLYRMGKEYSKAIDMFDEAINIYENCREKVAPDYLASVYSNKGLIYLDLQDAVQARVLFLKAKEILENGGEYPFALGTTISNLAFAALIDRQASEAVELLREAKSLFEAAGSPEMAQGCEDLLSKLEAKQ